MRDIFESKDREIIDYLLSSDYEENLTEDEYRYLLKKFKQFYRNSLLKNEQLAHQIDNVNKETKDKLLAKDVDTQNKEKKIQAMQSKLDVLINSLNRKLTLKERIKGKIITTDGHKEI